MVSDHAAAGIIGTFCGGDAGYTTTTTTAYTITLTILIIMDIIFVALIAPVMLSPIDGTIGITVNTTLTSVGMIAITVSRGFHNTTSTIDTSVSMDPSGTNRIIGIIGFNSASSAVHTTNARSIEG